MKERCQLIIAGEGGQGVVLAGALLGEAAVRAGFNAAHTSSYGIATRGGYTRSDIIIVPPQEEIAYPRVRQADLIAALSPGAFARLKQEYPRAALLADPRVAEGGAGEGKVLLPWEETARGAGGMRFLNMVVLGALIGYADLFPLGCLEEVVRRQFPGERGENNCRALRVGHGLIRDWAG